ncbi:CvpA family protein [Aliiglaciecola sp. 3_MG-2023]|uniref:CvpA family protein n=1 Tax=Alteromonadaceae TaxID=72275 RepID=UPI001C08AF74|nr:MULTISPECIES: CvpA family protein [Aliiglaciecola]MBU2879981.1 CvpA family protein [Aliiglaciecola lipolytica]MDO6695301.1 CvpA family protein [Aliiglaciecola sp. 3_MG-2023]MDO6711019.1 CvpA family protein [Aliiglaciecola sp. 2_MG-2023]MDO6754229.1 CvpA family protein [Aliiglaciecola sp. 1_MG-2023]
MNWIDFTIIGVIAVSTIISLVRGFIKEAISLAIWFAAFFIASQFYEYLAVYMTKFDDQMVRNGVSIAILFASTLILGGLINYLIARLVQFTGLTGTDRALGSVFGIIRGILIVSAALFFLDTFTTASESSWWIESVLVPEFTPIIEWFFSFIQNNSSFLTPNK